MEEKLQELQKKLAEEETERKEMSESFSKTSDKQSLEKEKLNKVINQFHLYDMGRKK